MFSESLEILSQIQSAYTAFQNIKAPHKNYHFEVKNVSVLIKLSKHLFETATESSAERRKAINV